MFGNFKLFGPIVFLQKIPTCVKIIKVSKKQNFEILQKIHTSIQNTYFKKSEKKMSYKNEMRLKIFPSKSYKKNSFKKLDKNSF